MNLRRILAGLALVLVTCSQLAGPLALAGAVDLDEEVWCLGRGNRAQVVNTAETMKLGKAVGSRRALIVPRGSSAALDLDEWQSARPQDFSAACEQAHASFGGGDAVPDEESTLAKVGIAAASGGFVAGVGGVISYKAAKRGRKDEHSFQRAVTRSKQLIADLALLDEAVDRLATGKRAGDDPPEESLKARSCATRLESTIRSAEIEGDAAIEALEELKKEIEAEDDDNRKVNALRVQLAGAKVETEVQDLIRSLDA